MSQKQGLVNAVGHEQDTAALFSLNPQQLLLHLFPCKIIQGRKGLVHHDEGNDTLNLSLVLVLFFQAKGNIVPNIQPGHEPRLLEHKCGLMGQPIPYFPFIRLFQSPCKA